MSNRKELVVFVAHGDDETIGCGGLLPLLKRQGWEIAVVIASSCRINRYGTILDNRADVERACDVLGAQALHFLDLDDQHFEKYPTQEIIARLDGIKLNPSMMITHFPHDLNRDHRIIHEIAMLYARPTDRRTSIICSEIINNAEYFGIPFQANFYVDIAETLEIKKEAFNCYRNELRHYPHPHSPEGLEIMARRRGLEVGLAYAEAYHVIRWFPAWDGGS
jgi:N-acetylglucosamine malate deacetylase 1